MGTTKTKNMLKANKSKENKYLSNICTKQHKYRSAKFGLMALQSNILQSNHNTVGP